MVSKPSETTIAKLKRDFEEDWSAYKRQQLKAKEAELEREHQEARKAFLGLIEGVDQWWPTTSEDNSEAPEYVSPLPRREQASDQDSSESKPEPPQTSSYVQTPSIRQMMQSTLPQLSGRTFKSADVRAGILQKWPTAEENSKYLSSRISQLLKQMVSSGQVELVQKGKRVQDPNVYRVKESDGDKLLSL